jgi:GGDEF domain-containing protein
LPLYLIDLERFKNINDSLGQPAGDALLEAGGAVADAQRGDRQPVARVGRTIWPWCCRK